MPDLPNLDSLTAPPLTEAQIDGILAQIDLDVANLLRDGKLAALKYELPGDGGRSTDRAANLQALLAARDHYQQLKLSLPAWELSHATDPPT